MELNYVFDIILPNSLYNDDFLRLPVYRLDTSSSLVQLSSSLNLRVFRFLGIKLGVL